jgi:TRAP-type C4-dicarboxylate transport system permease small subunit
MAYWGRFHNAHPLTLPVGGAFQPAHGRPWLVRFWELDGKWVALALPFGFILWVLFFFDHNVSVRHSVSFLFHLMPTNGGTSSLASHSR